MARPFQYRLRTLFWLLALAAIGCLIVPRLIEDYQERQRKERARIQREKTMEFWDSPSTTAPVR